MAHNHTLPNMETITSSIESSLENGSLNHLKMSSSSGSNSGVTVGGSGGAVTGQCGSDSQKRHHFSKTIELKSEIPLPEYWEQFLDMQTGEIYYKNRKTGIKVTEDPRTTAAEDDRGSYDRQGSSSESTASSSTDRWSHKGDRFVDEFTIFVAVGCKECLMYYMVPKLSKDCPRCHGPLLRF
ncbi:uncharacterized protein LOC111399241 [Olea europaea var. sylvestris]|uniref:uncharacterized protein LOC111399241 n=1 Tax=Olea europaea var. sylvestris TaxID=158386 RepID=UPI000C1D4EDE|nr:uncharacterized protein LOC111399241 [Olea europaea var. sylvestris]